MSDEKNEVLLFIKNFQNEGTIKTFTEGCCYWFAHILYSRFIGHHCRPEIFYNEVSGHFATLINGRLYDVTGEITKIDDKWINWHDYLISEPSYSQIVIRDCILKLNI